MRGYARVKALRGTANAVAGVLSAWTATSNILVKVVLSELVSGPCCSTAPSIHLVKSLRPNLLLGIHGCAAIPYVGVVLQFLLADAADAILVKVWVSTLHNIQSG